MMVMTVCNKLETCDSNTEVET